MEECIRSNFSNLRYTRQELAGHDNAAISAAITGDMGARRFAVDVFTRHWVAAVLPAAQQIWQIAWAVRNVNADIKPNIHDVAPGAAIFTAGLITARLSTPGALPITFHVRLRNILKGLWKSKAFPPDRPQHASSPSPRNWPWAMTASRHAPQFEDSVCAISFSHLARWDAQVTSSHAMSSL